MKKALSEIEGFENCTGYLIYDDGTLYNEKKDKTYKPLTDSKGYKYYDIRHLNARYSCPKVHRLVMLAFSEEVPKPQINHIDGNKSNNSLDNLEWVTNKQNRTHAIDKGLKDEVRYGIAQYDKQGNLVEIYDTCRDALKALGRNYQQSGNIGRAIRGKRATAYGYIWKQCESSTTIPKGSRVK